MNIIHCFRAPVGGLFRHVVDLATEQTALGHQVGVVCASGDYGEAVDGQLDALTSRCAYGVFRTPMSRLPGPGDIRSYRAVRKYLEKFPVDVVHGHGAKGGAYARLASRALGCRAVYTPHGGVLHYDADKSLGRILLMAEKWLLEKTDGIIFESRYARSEFSRKVDAPNCATSVIYNGLDDAEFDPVPNEAAPFEFLFVGEIRALKGIQTLIDAAEILSRKREFRVLIVGDGPDKARFLNDVRARGLERVLIFHDPVFPARKVFSQGRCLVVPSDKESLPYIVLEAGAAGMPVIATDVGGVGEILGDHRDCLIPPGNPQVLARAMEKVLLDRQAATANAISLSNRIRSIFNRRRMASEISRFYQSLAESRT